jgi:hypothetical protein
MNAKAGILVQLVKALDNVKNQMQADFNMICRRYNKLFQSLNKALETRIRELDRPAMQMADVKQNIIFDRLKNDSAMMLSASEDTISVSQFAVGGKIKQKTRETMRTLYDSTVETRSYNEKLESILLKDGRSEVGKGNYFFLPVVFSSAESLLNSSEYIETVFTAQTDILQNSAPIVMEIKQTQNKLKWDPLDLREKEKVKKEFVSLCESSGSDERLTKELLRLFDDTSWEVL